MRIFIVTGFRGDNRQEETPAGLYIGHSKQEAQEAADRHGGSFRRVELGILQYVRKLKVGQPTPVVEDLTEGIEENAAEGLESNETLIARLQAAGPEKAQLVTQCASLKADLEAREQALSKTQLELTAVRVELAELRKKKAATAKPEMSLPGTGATTAPAGKAEVQTPPAGAGEEDAPSLLPPEAGAPAQGAQAS